MSRFPMVLRGYDCGQVDAAFDYIERAVRYGHAITVEQLARFDFDIAQRGYDQRSVDASLTEWADRLRPIGGRPPSRAGLLIAWIQKARFSGAGMRAGYDVHEVDALLDRVVAGLSATGPQVTSHDVRGCVFRRVRMGPGYDEREVDRFLDRLAAALDELSLSER